MKKHIPSLISSILIILSFSLTNTVNATHVQGGEITMSCLGGNQYEIRLALYRDCDGINAPGSATINFSSASCGINSSVTLNPIANTGAEVSPICPTESTACSGGGNPGVQEYIYTAIITLSACDDWVISYSINARNGAISTINNPGGESMYIESEIDNLNFPCNSSPTFTNKPVPFICVGQEYCFNNGATDLDGDSLSYTMVAPQTSATTTVTYNAPYSETQPLASTPAITIDPATGDICMTPTQQQVTVFAVLVTEWRNGVKVGEIRRDIQIRTIPCNNTNPYLNGIDGTGNYEMDHCIGTPIDFDIPSFDDDGDNVTITWNNGIAGGTFTPGTGTTPTGNFSWNPTLADVSTTPYCFTITVVDDNCPYFGSQSYSFCISVGGFATSTTVTNVNCNANNGKVGVQPTGGVGPYTYSWAPGGQTSANVNSLSGGDYISTVTDILGCTVIDTVIVAVNQAGNASANGTDITCNGFNDGTITASLTGPAIQGPLTYTWAPAIAGNPQTASNLSPGSYHVYITDIQGCWDTITYTITEPTPLALSTNSNNTGCFGGSTGNATANPTGGTPPYSYLWMPGAFNTATINLLPIGTYTTTIKDDNNCEVSTSVTIDQPTELDVVNVVVNANCGQADGTASVTGSGGFAPYTFSWSNGQNGANATNLAAGTYTVTIIDNAACTKTFPVTIGNNAGPTVQITNFSNVSCNGGNNGNITITASGGTLPYTYLWSNGQTTPTASNLAIGLYSIIITDANGCSASLDSTITEPLVLTNNFIVVDPVCFGDATGSISTNPLGGTTPYTYIWSSAGTPTTSSISNLTAGTYTVTITDANLCNISESVTLNNPLTVNTTIIKTDVQCFSACDGTAATTITNGIAPYTYSWNDPLNQSTATATFLCDGTYQVDITDGNGCTSQAITTINEPTELTSTETSHGNLSCYQVCIGFSEITTTGGTAPYAYLWSNGNTTSTSTNLCAGTYNCTVTDANGCTSVTNTTITEPTELTATITATNIKCFGECDGTGNIAFSGGTAPYSFLWSPGLQTINNPNDLCTGPNTGKITDANGCIVTETITLTESLPILVTVQTSNASNCGQANGGACVTPSGGQSPYTYVWNNPSVSNTDCISNEFAGAYTVDVRDAIGCLKSVALVINDLAAPTIVVNSQVDLSCNGDNNGTATTTVSGGLAPYTFLWSPGNQAVQNPIDLSGGINTITVTDAAGCSFSTLVNTLEPSAINSTLDTSINVTCFGLCNGSAIADAVGGTGVLTYSWNDAANQNTAAANNLCEGNYTVTITDANGCEKTNNIVISEPNELVIDNNSSDNLTCFQNNTGTITTSIIGGTPFYTYNWTPNVSTSATATNLAAGNYALQVADQNGCTVNGSWVITEPTILTATSSQIDAACGMSSGSGTINPTGGTAPYLYQWNDPSLQTVTNATGLFAGGYLVDVTDNNGCTFSQAYTILDQSGPIIDDITFTAVGCFGGNNGTASVILDANNGTAPFSYAWNPSPQTLADISGLSEGTYTVTVTDDNNCTTGGNVTVTQPPLLELFTSQDETICFGDTVAIYGQGSGGVLPYAYNWTGGTGLTATETNEVFPVGTTTYNVDITDNNGCTAGPLSIAITVLPTLNILAFDNVMCQNDSVLVLSTPSGGNGDPYTYSWDNGDTTQNTMVNPLLASSPITYTVTLNDGCSTPVSASAIVTVNPTPIVDSIATNDVLCYGGNTGTANVYMNNASGQPPYLYDWGFTSQGTTLISGLIIGEYFVDITDDNGCIIRDSILINQPDSITITAINDSICFGATASISATTTGGISPYTYTWIGVSTADNTAGPFQVTPVTSTNYNVSVTDDNNCNSPTITVEVLVGDSLKVVATDDVVCENNMASIAANGSGGGTPYTYTWDNGIVGSSQNLTINQTDTYVIVTLTDGCSTPAIDTSFITINSAPTGSITSFPNNGCAPLEVTFKVVTNDGIEFYWKFGDNANANTVEDTIVYTYINDGNYDLNVTIVNLEGCSTLIDTLNYIQVYPNPIADFSMNPLDPTVFNPSVDFTDLSFTNIFSWDWDFSGLNTSMVQHPTYEFPPIDGDYPITLKVTDINGCMDSITKILNLKPEWAFYVPNSFIPDGDNNNDNFHPKGFGIATDDYSFMIFDRWGELIYTTHEVFGSWNGIYKGNLVKSDVYIWKAEFKDLNGHLHNRIGRVTLIK